MREYQPSGTNRLIAKSASEIHEQGMIVLLDTANNKVVKATDTTTNRKMGGLVVGYDQPASGAESLVDIGGCKVWLKLAMKVVDTGGTVALTGGSSGSVDTVTADGVSILPAPVAYATSLTVTAAAVAAAINAAGGRFYATSSSATITVRERVATKASWTLASTVTTITKTDTSASGGFVANTSVLNTSLYVVDEETVTSVAGNAIIGTLDDSLEEDGETEAYGLAAFGIVDLSGSTSGSLTQITANAVNLLGSTVTWATSATVTAGLVAAEINLNVGTSGYFAEARGEQVYIFQTTGTLSEDVETIAPTGTMDNVVRRHVQGGRIPRVLVKLRAYNAALT